jgi:hypothetical protein
MQANPQPGYPPPPNLPPPIPFAFELRTQRGLRFINWGLWINAIAMLIILGSVVGLASWTVSFLLAILMGEVLLLAFFILALMGIFNMNTGKYEFGASHSASVSRAIIFIVIAVIILVAGGFSSAFFLIGSIGLGNEPGIDWRVYQVIQLVLGFIVNMFISLMWVYLIIEIAGPRIRNYLWLYLGMSMSVYAIAGIILFDIWWLPDRVNLTGSLGIIAGVVLIYCYWKTYNRVLSGDIKPVPMPPLPYYPPGHPPYQPPQVPPSYPPQYLKEPYRR